MVASHTAMTAVEDSKNGVWIGTTSNHLKKPLYRNDIVTSLRKHTAAWLLVLTALAASSVGGSFIYLRDEIQTDPAFIETQITKVAASRGLDLAGARKEKYSEQEIVAFLVKANRAEFDHQWYRILAIVGSLYFVLVLGVLAAMLRREAKS